MTSRSRLVPAARVLALVLVAALVIVVSLVWWQSRRPGAYGVTEMGAPDHGGAHAAGAGSVSVTSFIVDPARDADVVIDLVASQEKVSIGGGPEFDGITLNGTTPGPTIRARLGDLIEVRFTNRNVADGAAVHWHGVDVPAAMDGVAGVTQDAVEAGETFVYRFLAEQVGSFWYHSHQVSHRQVVAGLFGALILEPAEPDDEVRDVVAMAHTYPDGVRSIGDSGREMRVPAAPGERIRVRVVNTDNSPISAWASEPFTLRAIDGSEIHGPAKVTDERVLITAGGRADVEVTIPASGGVRLQVPGASVLLGNAADPPPQPQRELDLLHYGTPSPLAFDAERADRVFRYDIGRWPGFLDGRPGIWWTINGRSGDEVPMFMVAEGDVVHMSISNSSGEVHPMHLHGHHMLVLSRDGEEADGSPWWVDSLDVAHGETYEVVFLADNPGIWMDHCHNLPHAVEGLLAHVAYEGVSTPFMLGADTGNEPE